MNKGRTLLTVLACLVCLAGDLAWAGGSANTTANATQTVIGSISIVKNQDLLFGTAAPGDVAKTVLATSGTDRASFTVSGAPATVYTITLPAASINMITNTGATADERISVGTWTSSPTPTGTLDGSGNDTLYVGATRAALSATQQAGSYSGAFTVTVTY